ncbi:MAG: hypothetical protein ACM3N9_08180 [Syntrophothermus sp.]
MEDSYTDIPVGTPPRPKTLTVLCVLTFISSGLNFLSSLISFLFPQFYQMGVELTAKVLKIPDWEQLLHIPGTFFLFSAILFAGSAAGALWMWKMRREGFHIYTISQILLIFNNMFYINNGSPQLFDVMVTGLFIYLYSRFLKIMN